MSSEPDYWEITIRVLVPKTEADTDDKAIDLVGDRLKPWPWAGQMPMPGLDPE